MRVRILMVLMKIITSNAHILRFTVGIVFTILLCSFDVRGQEPATDNMASAIERVINEGQTVGIAAGAIRDTSTWFYGAGFRDVSTQALFTEHTITRIASIAKPMTAIATLQLVEQGKLSLDDPISKYIPEIKNKKLLAATVKHLLQHTSGVKAYKNKKEANNTKQYPTHLDAAELFMNRKLLFDPGEGYRYSTYNYTLLSIILERVSGQSYEAYMQEHIFDVAGMSSTSVEEFGNYPEGKATIYTDDNGFKAVTDSNLSDRVAGDGIQSTVHDVLLFAKAVTSNLLISEESFKLMIEDSGMKKEGNPYGVGWFLYGDSQNSGPIIGHTGGQVGCTAMLIIIPGAMAATVAITNVAGVPSVSQIANDLFAVVAEMK